MKKVVIGTIILSGIGIIMFPLLFMMGLSCDFKTHQLPTSYQTVKTRVNQINPKLTIIEELGSDLKHWEIFFVYDMDKFWKFRNPVVCNIEIDGSTVYLSNMKPEYAAEIGELITVLSEDGFDVMIK